jgi:hypothetical protein
LASWFATLPTPLSKTVSHAKERQDFRLGGIGAPINGMVAFARTEQLDLADKFANALALATSPVVRALFDFDGLVRFSPL